MKTITPTDPLALASESPDISALISEFENAQQNASANIGNIGVAEDVRYNRWSGKSDPPDGCKWQRNSAPGEIVRPYDGRPDSDVQLADELIAAHVDMDLTASRMAQIGAQTLHVTQMTQAQSAELIRVARWVQNVTAQDRRRGEELLSQMKETIGWCVVNTGWHERFGLTKRSVTREQFTQLVSAGLRAESHSNRQFVDALQQFLAVLNDPTLEDLLLTVVQSVYPNINRSTAKRVARELRDDHQTEFLDKQLEERRPMLRVLIPGYNFFTSGATDDLQKARGHLVVERFYEADLRNIGAARGWNKDFIESACRTQGQFSMYAEAQRDRSVLEDSRDRSIEIWTSYVRQWDEDLNAAGIYCTVFSPHIKPGSGGEASEAFYGEHYVDDSAHGQYPFCQVEREVVGPALDDSRGIPKMVRSDQKLIKKFQDMEAAATELAVSPPRVNTGPGWSKVKDEFAPGAVMQNIQPGADTKVITAAGNPQIAEKFIERIEKGSRRRFALPNNGEDGSHPSSWQMRQMRNAKRWLGCWEDAYWQMTVLCYQELGVEELAQIIGRFPQLQIEDLLQHRITLTFDARSLDNDWRKETLDALIQLLGIDKTGSMKTDSIIRIFGSYIDPTVMDEIVANPQEASAALFNKVQNEIDLIMAGNPPQMSENDASAGAQLQMAYAVIGKNPEYQKKLQTDTNVQQNLEAWVENKQHNVQETQISPMQGRLGTQQMPSGPVRTGAPQMAGAY